MSTGDELNVGGKGTDHQRFEAARLTRDARFDGIFLTAVRTTGVFCRSICPARVPHKENVSYFLSATSALDNGYRPCLRCHPERAPAVPFLSPQFLVVRALRAVREHRTMGSLDLSAVLNATPEAIGTAFRSALQSTPSSAIRADRLLTAVWLLDEARLAIATVAAATGFTSTEALRSELGTVFGRAAARFEKCYGVGAGNGTDTKIRLPLAFRPPFSWAASTDFLSPRATPGVESVDERGYSRTIQFNGITGSINVTPTAGNHVNLVIDFPDHRFLCVIVERVRRIFDLDADPLAVGTCLAEDAALAPMVREYTGIRLVGAWDIFELVVRAILGQQVSVATATALAGRLVAGFGKRVSAVGLLTHVFPTPDRLASARPSEFAMTRQRAEAIIALAKAVDSQSIKLESIADPTNLERQLLSLPGVGPWTARYAVIRGLSHPDTFLDTDLAIRKVTSELFPGANRASLRRRIDAWRPWRSYAMIYLWKKYGLSRNRRSSARTQLDSPLMTPRLRWTDESRWAPC